MPMKMILFQGVEALNLKNSPYWVSIPEADELTVFIFHTQHMFGVGQQALSLLHIAPGGSMNSNFNRGQDHEPDTGTPNRRPWS